MGPFVLCANAAVVLLLLGLGDMCLSAPVPPALKARDDGASEDAKAPPCDTRGWKEDLLMILSLLGIDMSALVGDEHEEEVPPSKGGAAALLDD
mmetsp:Transcript_27245/g.63746  ORF Transcript_27245/g.63746 Transcript_27245/m.63746 type:complete len:94 (-) Transcript_27245:121-402(-)|eukprot:CAMPEP_0185806932 /NCGR_PEP_ID=MMETSP1322-20130828/4715_1 /TAXON_ID=265543 /ORGANISM="Minutocellus polymorphus, Strain RCC2270" /LENGTH=93 /DNA_ID=CAMNT_0028503037 /DNA_START=210 /DNA_END=491 /DNA_ORIENTATION=-